jgi:hypothetical protein
MSNLNLFLLLRFADLTTTYIGIEKGLMEFNPVQQYLLNKSDYIFLSINGIVSLIVYFLFKKYYRYKISRMTLALFNILNFIVVVINLMVIRR